MLPTAKLTRGTTLFVVAILFVALLSGAISPLNVYAAHSRVELYTANDFAVLGGSAINNINPTTITGDVGLSPSAWPPGPEVTCGEVTGTIYSVDAAGPLPCRVSNGGLLIQAKNDLTTAYNDAAGRPTTATIATELAGATLLDGTYDSASTTFEISAGGTLTLDGEGNPDSVFIFKMGSTLTTFSDSNVVLINGAQACNVFWQVGSSAVLGTSTTFVGNIMADQSITDNGGSTINGRLLARIAAVSLNNTTITRANCAGVTTEVGLTKSFSPATITDGDISILTITFTNTGLTDATVSGGFTDNFPAGLVISNPPNATTDCSGLLTASAGGSAVTMIGGTIPSNGICILSVDVTTAFPGSYINTIVSGALVTSNGDNITSSSASLMSNARTSGDEPTDVPENSPTSAAPNNPAATATNDQFLASTVTPVSSLTSTATALPVLGLPNAGGAPPAQNGFLWPAVLGVSMIGVSALAMLARARRIARAKQ